jgi:hypothetical protein
MKPFSKTKASKITYKSHRKHRPMVGAKKGRWRQLMERYTAL